MRRVGVAFDPLLAGADALCGAVAALTALRSLTIQLHQLSIVHVTTNEPDDRLTAELGDSGLEVHTLGDAVQARTASMAIYEARKLALAL